MSIVEILHEIEALPKEERLQLLERLHKLTDQDIPEAFRQGMAEAQRGELIDLDETLKEHDEN